MFKVLTPNSRLMTSHCIGAYPIINRRFVDPALDSVIVTCREKLVSDRMPFDELHILSMATTHRSAFKFFVFIGFPDPDSLIPTASSEILTIRGPCYTLHFVLMAFELSYQGVLTISISHHPNTSSPIKTCTC